MKSSPVLCSLIFALALLVGNACADSLQLRDGRHLHGKYVGGTENMVAFIADGTVQTYPVTDVLTLTFGDNGSPTSLDRFQPNSNSGDLDTSGLRIHLDGKTATSPTGPAQKTPAHKRAALHT